MNFERLARELDETSRQTERMAEGVTEALTLLADTSIGAEEARQRAAHLIVLALQGQDRVAQRCANLADAVRQFALLPPGTPGEAYDEIWSSLVLDELRVPGLSGSARKAPHGEIELF